MTEIIYVPGAPNHYGPNEDVIILDANIRDYPDAHGHVLKHELGHADPSNQSFFGFLTYEFRHDIEIHFCRDDGVEEFFEYYAERNNGVPSKFIVGNVIRSVWVLLMQPLGAVYRAIVSVKEN